MQFPMLVCKIRSHTLSLTTHTDMHTYIHEHTLVLFGKGSVNFDIVNDIH